MFMNDEEIVQPIEPIPVEEPASSEGEPVKTAKPVADVASDEEDPAPASR